MARAHATIRTATPDDAEAVTALWRTMAAEHQAYDREVWCWSGDAARHWQKHFEEVVSKPDMLILVAEAAGGAPGADADIVGFLVVEIRQSRPVFETKRTGFVWDIAVHPQRRRQGIATGLMRRALDDLRGRDVDDVILHAAVANTAAIRLYEKLGLRRVMYRMYRRL